MVLVGSGTIPVAAVSNGIHGGRGRFINQGLGGRPPNAASGLFVALVIQIPVVSAMIGTV